MFRRTSIVGAIVLLFCFVFFGTIVRAEEDGPLKAQIDQLNGAVKEKKGRVKELDDLIGRYKKQIQAQETKQITLQNEVVLLDNRMTEKQAAVLRAQTERDALNLEIQLLTDQIQQEQTHIGSEQEAIASLMQKIHRADAVSSLDVLLTRPSLSSFFDFIEQEKRLQRQLGSTLQNLKAEKTQLESSKKDRDDRRIALTEQEITLKKEQETLEQERNLKTSLVSETQQKEEEFQRMLYELKQQQQVTASDIATLEDRLKDKLNAVDQALARGDILLNWPVVPTRGVSAHFHDPSYPFRRLFEHPGTDIPTSVGTPVHAAGGGYVAWTKKGSAYGNYMMIVHPGGIATVYAHLTKFAVKADTYVDRGDIIAYSGGRPGDDGAGLSTGPHLHFEVRQGGIPVDAENFLPDIGE